MTTNGESTAVLEQNKIYSYDRQSWVLFKQPFYCVRRATRLGLIL